MSKSIFTEFADLLIKENWSLDVLLKNEHLVKVQLIGSPEMKSPTVGTECMLHLLKMTEQIYLLTVHQNGRLLARETINVSVLALAGTDKLRDWWDGYRATMLNCIHLAIGGGRGVVGLLACPDEILSVNDMSQTTQSVC
ncbi:uncharacterized protein LOC134850880 isoform X2 [Symsagittifera roscoffensis]|uniref:uncharacterized protein LOC134850880 isoform X2 n=1 Tax=Symsagittifera roscoffensis TaxID=84072 RepID=UPI00307BA1F2